MNYLKKGGLKWAINGFLKVLICNYSRVNMCMILFTFVLFGVWFLLSTLYFENANYL